MLAVITRLLAPTAVAAAVLAGPALAASGSSMRAVHHPARHARGSKSRSCPPYNDGASLISYFHVHATKLSCATVQAVEKKLAPKLASGSGPRGAVHEDVANAKFTCRAKLHVVPNELRGAGSCTASKHRRFTFDAAHYGQ